MRNIVKSIFMEHGIAADDKVIDQILAIFNVVVEEHVKYARNDVETDWRSALKAIDASREPLKRYTHRGSLLLDAQALVDSLREDRPMDPLEGAHPLDVKEETR